MPRNKRRHSVSTSVVTGAKSAAAASANLRTGTAAPAVSDAQNKNKKLMLAPMLTFSDKPKDSVYNLFRQGDLIFGLKESLKEVKAVLGLTFTFTIANDLNHPVVAAVIGSEDAVHVAQMSETHRAYYAFLNKHKDYLLRKPGKPVPALVDEPEKGAAFRRACKYLFINRDPGRTHRAHFLTKGMDWSRVVDKKNHGNDVTGSEIRAAYRDFKAHGENPFIFFYNDKHERQYIAPWNKLTLSKHWLTYDNLRQKKREALKKASANQPKKSSDQKHAVAQVKTIPQAKK